MEWVHYFQIARAYFHDLPRHTSLIFRSITYCLSNDILSQIIIHLTLEKTQSHNEENSILIWRIMENLQVSLKRETKNRENIVTEAFHRSGTSIISLAA